MNIWSSLKWTKKKNLANPDVSAENITDGSFVISKNSEIQEKQIGYWQKDA